MNTGLVDQIRFGWIVLAEAEDPSPGGLTTRPLAGELLLGRDGGGVPCLLVPADGLGPEEDVGVVTVRNRDLVAPGGTRTFVVIACGDQSLRDVFDHLLVGVVAALEADQSLHPGAVTIEVLAHWKELLRGTADALGPPGLAALLAELLVLEEVIEHDPAPSLTVWTGPSGARHDLRRGDHAVEVKSTLSHTARQITVNGVDQLEAPANGSLTLAWHRFEPVPDGPLSVFTVVDRLIAAGVSAVDLYQRLEAAGSPPSTRDVHDSVRFRLRERQFFSVDGDFPRITADTFPHGIPAGVDDLSYKVTLPGDGSALGAVDTAAVLAQLGNAT